VRSLTSASFWKLYAKLPADVRSQARKAYQLWFKEPYHPSLQFKNLQGGGGFCSVRINQQYRAVGMRQGDAVRWVWIGTHNDFDKQF
jgi:hypothetical protein